MNKEQESATSFMAGMDGSIQDDHYQHMCHAVAKALRSGRWMPCTQEQDAPNVLRGAEAAAALARERGAVLLDLANRQDVEQLLEVVRRCALEAGMTSTQALVAQDAANRAISELLEQRKQ